MQFAPGPYPLKINIQSHIADKARAFAAFTMEAAGIAGRLVYISALCSLSFHIIKGKARAFCRRVIFIHPIVASSMVMSHMKELPTF